MCAWGSERPGRPVRVLLPAARLPALETWSSERLLSPGCHPLLLPAACCVLPCRCGLLRTLQCFVRPSCPVCPQGPSPGSPARVRTVAAAADRGHGDRRPSRQAVSWGRPRHRATALGLSGCFTPPAFRPSVLPSSPLCQSRGLLPPAGRLRLQTLLSDARHRLRSRGWPSPLPGPRPPHASLRAEGAAGPLLGPSVPHPSCRCSFPGWHCLLLVNPRTPLSPPCVSSFSHRGRRALLLWSVFSEPAFCFPPFPDHFSVPVSGFLFPLAQVCPTRGRWSGVPDDLFCPRACAPWLR